MLKSVMKSFYEKMKECSIFGWNGFEMKTTKLKNLKIPQWKKEDLALKLRNRNVLKSYYESIGELELAKSIGDCHSVHGECHHHLEPLCVADESENLIETRLREITELKSKSQLVTKHLIIAVHNVSAARLADIQEQLMTLFDTLLDNKENKIKKSCYWIDCNYELGRDEKNLYKPHIHNVIVTTSSKKDNCYISKKQWEKLAKKHLLLQEGEYITVKLKTKFKNPKNEELKGKEKDSLILSYAHKGAYTHFIYGLDDIRLLLSDDRFREIPKNKLYVIDRKKTKKESPSNSKDNSTSLCENKKDLDKENNNNQLNHKPNMGDNQAPSNIVYVGGDELMTIIQELKEQLHNQSKIIENLMKDVEELKKGHSNLDSKPTFEDEPISPKEELNKPLKIESSANIENKQTIEQDIDRDIVSAAADEKKETLDKEETQILLNDKGLEELDEGAREVERNKRLYYERVNKVPYPDFDEMERKKKQLKKHIIYLYKFIGLQDFTQKINKVITTIPYLIEEIQRLEKLGYKLQKPIDFEQIPKNTGTYELRFLIVTNEQRKLMKVLAYHRKKGDTWNEDSWEWRDIQDEINRHSMFNVEYNIETRPLPPLPKAKEQKPILTSTGAVDEFFTNYENEPPF